MVQAEVDEPAQVDGGGSQAQPEAVAFHAAVADSAVSVGHDPGERAFHHGAVVAVGVDTDAVAPVGSGSDEEFVVWGEVERLPGSAGGASAPQRALAASGPECGVTLGTDRHRLALRAGHRASLMVDGEVVTVELVITEPGVT